MIKVLKKTFSIITFIASRNGNPVLPGEIVNALELNQPTTIRILKDLVELGYLEQVSRTRGYQLGPLAYWVTGNKKYKSKLVNIADQLVKSCAEELGESVMLANRHGHKRYILVHYNYNKNINVVLDKPFYDDIYKTATGRVMLAFYTPEELREFVTRKGIPPKSIWPEAQSLDTLQECLQEIRKNGSRKFLNTEYRIAAFPVFEKDNFVAALGISIPHNSLTEEEYKKKFNKVLETAKLISSKLSQNISIG